MNPMLFHPIRAALLGFVLLLGYTAVLRADTTPPPPVRGPWIFVYPGYIEATHNAPPETTIETLTIENSGPDFVFYSLHTAATDCNVPDGPAWLLPGSGGGNLPPQSLDMVQVQISSDGLTNGLYTALICVQDTAHPQNPYHQVFVQLTVAAPETPTSTPEPPTKTPEPPTATPEIPKETPEPPTATPELPTATPEPPTATATAPLPTPTPTLTNTPPPGATLTPTPPPTATPTASNTPPPGASLTPTPPPAAEFLYLPVVRRR